MKDWEKIVKEIPITTTPTDVVNSAAELAAAYAALPADTGGTILCDPGNYGDFTIDKPNVRLKTHSIYPSWDPDHWAVFGQLTLDSTTTALFDILIQGFYMHMLNFNCVGHNITYVDVKHNNIESDGSADGEGIVFDGNDVGETHNIYFDRNYFRDAGQSARNGFISQRTNNGGNGQYYFTRNTVYATGAGLTHALFALEDGGYIGTEVAFVGGNDIVCPAGGTLMRLFHSADQTNGARIGKIYRFNFSDNWIENQTAALLFDLDLSTEDTQILIDCHDNYINNGAAVTVIDNDNTNWNIYHSGFQFHHNSATADLTLGTHGDAVDFEVIGESNIGVADFP